MSPPSFPERNRIMNDERLASRVESALRSLHVGGSEVDALDSGTVRAVRPGVSGVVTLEVVVRPEDPPELLTAVRNAAAGVDGVQTVHVESTAPAASAPDSGRARALPIVGAGGRPAEGRPGDPRAARTAAARQAASRPPAEAPSLPGVRHVIAVSSGKGGVGKSTVSTNLAAAWARSGNRVGLMDADLYGPDIPTMFGVHERPRMADDMVVPLEAHGVRLMSLGFLVDEETPAIWRGPIIMGVVRQFLEQVQWGELDYLVVDLPPGTGDAQLSLCQLVRVTGAVMVTTPQDVSVGGVLKGIRMFERIEVPILGIVENMRGFVCPGCGDAHDIFGSGGGEALAASLDIPFLGAVPLGTAVREEGDRGIPTVIGRPDSPEAQALAAVARAAEHCVEALDARMAGG
jgi:ATP-binding protein involved in chromosome partitioning